MPIVEIEPTAQRGRKDARRHREKQKEALKRALPSIISEETIITRKRGKTVRIPIRMLEIPHFRPKRQEGGGGAGIGQGSGKPGDVIGRRPGQGQQPGSAGQEPGQDYIETDVEFAELIELLFEDLGLPNLQEKKKEELEVLLGWTVTGLTRSAPWTLFYPRATARQGIRRFWTYLAYLQRETGRDELACYDALRQAQGLLDDAFAILADPEFVSQASEVEPFPCFEAGDLRFRKVEAKKQKKSTAVVIAMMDVSGSMTTTKKYFARSMLFWIVEALRLAYDNVIVRFIVHHTEARVVDEETFFHTVESGGTYCYKAYGLASELVENEYPTTENNVYVFHYSDGDDFDPQRSVQEIKKLFAKDVNMVGYGEIHVDGARGSPHALLRAMEKEFPIVQEKAEGVTVYAGPKEVPFLGVIIEEKEHLWPAIREYLRKDRWSQ